jgi:asparagine synthetase B (glutamine-hydrolysing)
VEWAFKLKGSLKVRRGETKHIVKQWLRGVLPDEILFRSKMGFGAPIRDWMERGLFARCHGLVDSRPEGRSRLYWGLRGRDLERKMRSLNFQQNYALLVLELWFRIFVDGAPPEDLSRELKK